MLVSRDFCRCSWMRKNGVSKAGSKKRNDQEVSTEKEASIRYKPIRLKQIFFFVITFVSVCYYISSYIKCLVKLITRNIQLHTNLGLTILNVERNHTITFNNLGPEMESLSELRVEREGHDILKLINI